MSTERVHMLLGDYPATAAIKDGTVRSALVAFDFPSVKFPHTLFPRVVRDLEFDIAELAVVTFLIARAHGKPLTLLPAVVLGRSAHAYLAYDSVRGTLGPRDLEGRRVGIRSHSVTTVTWLRGILANDYGVDLGRIHWVTFEDPHVAEFRDPPGMTRAAPGKEMTEMLLAGEIDAAVLGAPSKDPRIKTVISDPAAAALAWREKYRAVQVNHMVAVKDSFVRAHPDAVREVYRMLVESKRAAGLPKPDTVDQLPFGFANNRRNIEVAIDYAHQQELIPRRFAVEELFDDVTRGL